MRAADAQEEAVGTEQEEQASAGSTRGRSGTAEAETGTGTEAEPERPHDGVEPGGVLRDLEGPLR